MAPYCFTHGFKQLNTDVLLLQAAQHLDDEEDVEDEETALENYTTAVDNEETDEYIAFKTSLQGTVTAEPCKLFMLNVGAVFN